MDDDVNLFWDKDGTPLETLEWARKYEDLAYRFVGQNQIGPYRVSTLWMGFGPTCLHLHVATPPAVFQTAVFEGGRVKEERNYFTEADALAGHQETITVLRATR